MADEPTEIDQPPHDSFEAYEFPVRDVDVTPDGLTDFTRLVDGDAAHHRTSWLHGAGQAMERIPQFGASADGAALTQVYHDALSSLHLLMRDVGEGLTSLGGTATNLAEAYAGSDDAASVGFDAIEPEAMAWALGINEPWQGPVPRSPNVDPYGLDTVREQAGEDFDALQDGDGASLEIGDTDVDMELAEGSAVAEAIEDDQEPQA